VSEEVTAETLVERFPALLAEGLRVALVAGHDDGDRFRVVYSLVGSATAEAGERRHELEFPLDRDAPVLPTLALWDFPTSRFEREIVDLFGVSIAGHPLARRLVRHSHWPSGWHPMRRDAGPNPGIGEGSGVAPFVEASGTGVYEIPVGPVHAGLIEPGHFRFSVVGETVLQLKARLWYVHRGVEKLFEGRRPEDGFELAERISGDTAVGHSLAYAQAVERAWEIDVPEEDRWVRALLLELERLHNHVADLGMLANDVAFGISNAHAQRLRERLLRLNLRTTGHRLLRGGVCLGGARAQSLPDAAEVRQIAEEMAAVAAATLANSTVRDRFRGTAILAEENARGLGTLGYVARASGVAVDARADHPFVDLGPDFSVVTETGGDVMARYLVRLREVAVSSDLVTDLVTRLSGHLGSGPTEEPTGPAGHGLGLIEGWRGTIAHRVEIAGDGTLSRVKVVDPSFFNWPALPVAMADTIVPDFPLANKSFNQSYAGNDL
jgi:Ni,Fe-hydrogenase III large subunit/Ni,Fe-hydrogenase III component G